VRLNFSFLSNQLIHLFKRLLTINYPGLTLSLATAGNMATFTDVDDIKSLNNPFWLIAKYGAGS